MEYELKRRQALVIAGPQGCGKSTLARNIADQAGSFVETNASQLEMPRGLDDLLEWAPETLIVDGFPTDESTLTRLKAAITDDEVLVARLCGGPRVVKAPNFIFCTGDAQPLPLEQADRRFRVVYLGPPKNNRTPDLAALRASIDRLNAEVLKTQDAWPARYPVPPEVDALIEYRDEVVRLARCGDLRGPVEVPAP